MTQKIIYAVYPQSEYAVQGFMERLVLAGIQTEEIKSSGKYSYFESSWNDSYIPKSNMQNKNLRNAGAKLKDLKYNGKSLSCGYVYLWKYQKHLSNLKIGQLFGVSESTISRRVKKHLKNGNFYEESKVIF